MIWLAHSGTAVDYYPGPRRLVSSSRDSSGRQTIVPPFDLAFKCNRHIHTNCIGKPLFQQEQVGIVLRSSWTRYRWPLDRRRPREGFCLSHGQTVLDDVTRNLSGVIGGNQRAGAPCGQGPADQHILNHVR